MEPSQHEQPYLISVSPPLPAGAQLGYRRIFELANYLPLTKKALAERARDPAFPGVFHQSGTVFYGVSFEVTSEMEALTLSLQFPSTVEIRSSRAVALVDQVQETNERETSRINDPAALTRSQSDMGDTLIELNVSRPLAGHGYLLLYEPGKEPVSMSARG